MSNSNTDSTTIEQKTTKTFPKTTVRNVRIAQIGNSIRLKNTESTEAVFIRFEDLDGVIEGIREVRNHAE